MPSPFAGHHHVGCYAIQALLGSDLGDLTSLAQLGGCTSNLGTSTSYATETTGSCRTAPNFDEALGDLTDACLCSVFVLTQVPLGPVVFIWKDVVLGNVAEGGEGLDGIANDLSSTQADSVAPKTAPGTARSAMSTTVAPTRSAFSSFSWSSLFCFSYAHELLPAQL